MSKSTDEELIDKLIAETEDGIPVIDANTLDGQTEPPGDGRFDALYMNNQGSVVITLGDGKTGFQILTTPNADAGALAMVRFTSTHIENDVTAKDFETATLPFMRIDFDNERALDSMIAVLQQLKTRWTEKKLAKQVADQFEVELLKSISEEVCPHDPTQTTGPIGMYHCPDCGEMVIAGVAHP